jgi:hypothetical protein
MDVVTIPLVAMAGLYLAYNQDNKSKACVSDSGIGGSGKGDSRGKEGFNQRSRNYLPNVDVPNTNYPEEYPVQNPPNDLTSKLSTVNTYDGKSVYTDKYFNPKNQQNEQEIVDKYFKCAEFLKFIHNNRFSQGQLSNAFKKAQSIISNVQFS